MRAKIVAFVMFAWTAALVLPGISAAADHSDDAASSFWDQILDGDFSLSLRYRYEFVDQDSFSKDAKASTLRTRLTYATPEYDGWSFLIEADDIRAIGNELYNSTENGNTSRPVVADPEGTEINQAYVQWIYNDIVKSRIGRQRINRDNQRFIGGVGWRQNEQTYDSVGASFGSIDDVVIDYAYIQNINRIFGPNNGANKADWDSNSHILNGAYTGLDNMRLSGYAYLLDIESADSQSNQTYGVRLAGNYPLSDNKIVYSAEVAHQSDYADNPTSYSANYYLIEGGLVLGATSIKDLTFKAGFEVLQGDDIPGEQFRTPLATLHKFQGWADQFLATPDGGVEDLYLSASGSVGKTKLMLVYHDFEGEEAGGSLGTEWDFSAARPIGKYVNALLKFAFYDSDGFKEDTDKVWLMLTSNFK